MALTIKAKRGTRAQINSAASADGLVQGEIYLITDEDRFAIGLSVSTYETYAKESEGGGGLEVNTELTADTTLSSSHANKYIPVNSATAKDITIDGSVFSANDAVAVEQTGAGVVTLVQGTGMTLNGEKKTWGQYSVLYIFFKSATVATVTGGSA